MPRIIINILSITRIVGIHILHNSIPSGTVLLLLRMRLRFRRAMACCTVVVDCILLRFLHELRRIVVDRCSILRS